MTGSDFLYDNIIATLTLNYPVYVSAGVNTNESYAYMIDVGGSANPKWLRDSYVVKFYGSYSKNSYQQGMEDMTTIKDNILGHPNITDADGNIWCNFLLRQSPFFIGTDDQSRDTYTMEFEITKDGLTGVHRQPII